MLLVTSVRHLSRQAKSRLATLEQGLFQLYDHFVRMQDALAQTNAALREVSIDNYQLKIELEHERKTRMNENLTIKEALDTLSQKLGDANARNQQQILVFGTFAKNVMHKLDMLSAQASDPAVPALTADDFAEIKQMMDTADKIGLSGLSDFGVTPDGDHLPSPPAAPVGPAAPPAADPIPPVAAPVQPPTDPLISADPLPAPADPTAAPPVAPEPPAPPSAPDTLAPQEVQTPPLSA